MIHLIQYLCPHRHAIAATFYDTGNDTLINARRGLRRHLRSIGANPWCGICGSQDLFFEERSTPFTTIEEAAEAARLLEKHNEFTKAILDAVGATFDSKRQN